MLEFIPVSDDAYLMNKSYANEANDIPIITLDIYHFLQSTSRKIAKWTPPYRLLLDKSSQ
jgi:hypothetical protein